MTTKNNAAVAATLDYVVDGFKNDGRNENVNELIRKHAQDFIKLRPDMASSLIDMAYGEVLFEVLPKLVKAGGTFDKSMVLKRLVDCEVTPGFIDTLNSVDIPTEAIAEVFGNDRNWEIFFEKDLSPEWLVHDTEASDSALRYAIWKEMIPNLLGKCSPEARKDLFAKYLDFRTAERECAWEWSDYFDLRPITEAGVSNEEVLRILSDHGHVDAYELFRFKPDFLKLELDIDPKDYLLDYLEGCWEQLDDESPYFVNQFCDDYSVKLDDEIIRKIPESWLREMAAGVGDGGSEFGKFLDHIREAGVMNDLKERLFKNGAPTIDHDSPATEDEWLYLLLEGTV